MNDIYIGMNAPKFDTSFAELKRIRDELSSHNDDSVSTIKQHGNNLESKGPVATGLGDTGDVLEKISKTTIAYMDAILKYLDHVKSEIIKVDVDAAAYFAQQ